jgi:hypothetical protein
MNATEPTPSIIQALNDGIKKFEDTQKKYRDYGAFDTEPDWVFQKLLIDTVEGKQPNVPRSGQGWELYASSMDCETAAEELSNAAMYVIKLIENAPIKHYDAIKRRVNDYCWRMQ